MENLTNGNPESTGCAGSPAANCSLEWLDYTPFRDAIRTLIGKWKIEILWTLIEGTQRFGELRRALPGISQHMLTAQLRELAADGLVKRTAYAEIPPRVEYELTEAARALRPVFTALFEWSRDYGPLAQTARKAKQVASEPTARLHAVDQAATPKSGGEDDEGRDTGRGRFSQSIASAPQASKQSTSRQARVSRGG